MTASTPKTGMAYSRILLIGAALVAAVAVGRAMLHQEQPAPTDSGAPADSAALIAQLEARLKEEPGNAEGWRMLGWATFEAGRYAEAANAYRKAAALAPDNASYWSALGEAIVLSGRQGIDAEAMAAFRKAITADPQDARARYFLAAARAESGDAAGAIDDWFALLKDNPPDAPWASSVRERITGLAADKGIDVSARLAALPAPRPATVGGPTPEQVQAAAAMSPSEQAAMARGMVESLAARLETDPRNPQGWIMLMRGRKVLGDQAGAVAALEQAKAAYADDPRQVSQFIESAQGLGIVSR